MTMKLSIRLGNFLQLFMLCLAIVIAFIADHIFPFLISTIIFWYFSHCLTHYIVGSIFKIRFSYYFITTSSIKKLRGFKSISKYFYTLGIKIDWEKSKSGKIGFVVMFISGALASILCPFLIVLIAYVRSFKFESITLSALWILNTMFTLYFSSKVGDIHKAKRALKSDF